MCRCRNPKCPSTARDEKGVTMRYFSREILICCHRRWEGLVVPLVCGFITLRTFTSQKLAYDFGRNTSTLSEFYGYTDSTDCREITLEHPEIIANQSVSGNFDIEHIFCVASIYATRLAHF